MTSYTKTKMVALSLVACLALVSSVEAGRIGPVVDQVGPPAHSSGYNGWNLSNVNVKITDLDYNLVAKTFNPADGSYAPDMVLGDSFESEIHDSTDTSGAILVNLHGKDWPVGEPAGIKVMNHTDPTAAITHNKPASCIMTTSYFDVTLGDDYGDLSTSNPTETLCNSTFQSHKRFKLNMLSTMINANGDYGEGVNLTFNVEAEAGTRRYQVLQKINNYTDSRLDGFKVEVGFVGADGNFTKASDTNVSGNGPADIRLSIGEGENGETPAGDIWQFDEMANFSNGLWGAADDNRDVDDAHFTTNGFFDDVRAGYYVDRNETTKDTIYSTTPLAGNYTAIGTLPYGTGTVATQFGQWLPSIWEPTAIFHDEDNDPATDATLKAFWGDRGDGVYAWMKGNEDNFQLADADDLFGWASSPVFEVGGVEDVLNLGLNYIVEVGDISTFPAGETFTIRITPHVAADQTEPGYVSNTPPPMSSYLTQAGTITISPAPIFTIGQDLEVVVADTDLAGDSTLVLDVNVSGVLQTITINEVDSRAIFVGTLATFDGNVTTITDSNITLQAGSVVTITYHDDDNGTGAVDVDASVTALATPVAPATTSSSSSGGIFSTMDNVSLFAMIFGFLVIGGVIARKKIAA